MASVISFVNDVNSVGFPDSFHGIFDSLLSPLTAVAALCAWALLTRFEARDEGQLRILRLAYVAFAVQYILAAASYNFIFTPIHSFGGFWTTTGLWVEFLGALVTSVGLFLMSRSLVTIAEPERPQVNQF